MAKGRCVKRGRGDKERKKEKERVFHQGRKFACVCVANQTLDVLLFVDYSFFTDGIVRILSGFFFFKVGGKAHFLYIWF